MKGRGCSLSPVKIKEDIAVAFIQRNLSGRGLAAFLVDEKFRKFSQLIGDGKDIAAAEEYGKVTDASLAECHLAVVVCSQPKAAAK
jgi:hypothetical protein